MRRCPFIKRKDRNMIGIQPEPNADVVDPQIDSETGKPIGIAPVGDVSDGEIDEGARHGEKPARIDPNSRIPRPPQPDLA